MKPNPEPAPKSNAENRSRDTETFNSRFFAHTGINLTKYRAARSLDTQLKWQLTKAPNNTYTAVTPNRVAIQIDKHFDWDQSPAEQHQSTLLWIYSLIPVRLIIEQYQDYALADMLVRSFEVYLSSEAGERRLDTLTSRDHLTAEYLRTLTYLLTDPKFSARQEAQTLIESGLSWALIPGNIASNNHGMMLAMACMHARLFAPLDEHQSLAALEYVTERLLAILGGAFDSSGLCKENSPAYHHFYITYMRSILREAEILGDDIQSVVIQIHQLLDSAEQSLADTALPNGTLPPLGDGHHGNKVIEPSGSRFFYSEESGFCCVRDDESYFSMKCGASSITHKHVDDNSVYLWSAGEDVLTDGGTYNYDWEDPYTRCVKSQRGHSSPQYSLFDDLYPGMLYRGNGVRVHAGLEYSQIGEVIRLTGTSTIDERYMTRRVVELSSSRQFRIIDTFASDVQEARRVRFIINGHFSVEVEGHIVRAESSRNRLELSTDCGHVSVTRGTSIKPHFDGWAAKGFGNIEPAWAIDISVPDAAFKLESLVNVNPIHGR